MRVKQKDGQADIAKSCGISHSDSPLLNLFDAVVNLDIGNNDEEINYQISHILKFYTDKPPVGGGSRPAADTEGQGELGENNKKSGSKEKDLYNEDDLRQYIEECQKILCKVSQKAYSMLITYLKFAGMLP